MKEPSLDELAALDAIGALTDDESDELRRLVESATASEAAALTDYSEAAALIAESLEPVEPPPPLRERLLGTVSGARLIRAGEGTWRAIGPGLRMKRLTSDRKRNTVTLLLEFEAGAKYPGHSHRGAEDSWVVRGSCRFGAVVAREGDLFHVEPGQHHGDVISESGCLLLIVADWSDFAAA